MAEHDLIKCGTDGWAPWSMVCVHLADESSKKAIALPSNSPEVDYDWVCPDCYEYVAHNQINQLMAEDKLKAICMHCTRRIIDTCEQDLPEDDNS